MSWVRSGECCRCGDCCKGNPNRKDMPNKVKIPGFCPLYDKVNGLGVCTDRQHSYYLANCSSWPNHPDCIKDYHRCSFTFTWVKDGN